ncbi:bifunctional diaminohydroxyphosphoribosylaminopyrimidine deaminase/5-amino-6-(5-phosphoribosylamino)uracil reductase RibD [Endozoicomonas sp. Mp262]|uniref:bifunctional diaminohydroxyphosphoribosylaminopyrimidine deaminase/5-amino-6-(5-phosphoribosylamino)uracil reductase RibD n=1 Tax=Endozoicomonas sp. Mp262 TaxID=2919499 RepID=UPI0021D80893
MSGTFSPEDHAYMARAIRLASRGKWTTMPNPRVGCVIVRNGEITGEGWHQWAGEGHAEVHALAMAGKNARNATAYVSLEPCSHYGRTPPCAKALIKAGVTRVIAAMQDPNPSVAGRGLAMLKEAGIEVHSGLLEAEARKLNLGFIKRMETGRPLVKAKLAMSMDGRTAMASGESQWITGSDARRDVQQLRAASCAIITGVGSILHDDSSLTLREEQLGLPDARAICKRQPLRVVVDSRLRTPVLSKVISGPGHCLIVATSGAAEKKKALEQAGAEVLIQEEMTEHVCLTSLIDELGRRGCNEVLLETGATLAGAMLQEQLIDELYIYMAPLLMGSCARPLFQLPFETMAEKQPMTICDIQAVGNDWRITAKPKTMNGSLTA